MQNQVENQMKRNQTKQNKSKSKKNEKSTYRQNHQIHLCTELTSRTKYRTHRSIANKIEMFWVILRFAQIEKVEIM